MNVLGKCLENCLGLSDYLEILMRVTFMSYEFFFDLSKSPQRKVLFRFYFLKIIFFVVVFCSFRMFYEIFLVSVLKICVLCQVQLCRKPKHAY